MLNRCARIQYDKKSTLSNRSAAIGYGTKYNFTKITGSNPGPGSYKMPSIFDKGKIFGLGGVWGVSRS